MPSTGPASGGSHVRGALWQVLQNRFQKDQFRCGGTRARARRVRGGVNAPVWGPSQRVAHWKRREYLRSPGVLMAEAAGPIRSGSLLTPLHPCLLLSPNDTARHHHAGATDRGNRNGLHEKSVPPPRHCDALAVRRDDSPTAAVVRSCARRSARPRGFPRRKGPRRS